MKKKSLDYQSNVSGIKQADYYPNGVQTIYDFMHAKMLRIRSILAKTKAGEAVQFESLEDSFKDLANYASFACTWSRGQMDGQGAVDLFNRPLVAKSKT